MNTPTFSCPYCSSPLRIRDRAFVDREVGCPDCGERIEITLDEHKTPIARKVPVDETTQAPPKPTPRKRSPKLKRRKNPLVPPAETSDEPKAASENATKASSRVSRKPHVSRNGRSFRLPAVLLSPVGIAWSVAGLVGLTLLILAWPTAESSPIPAEEIAGSPAGGLPSETALEVVDVQEEFPLPDVPLALADGNIVKDRLRQLGLNLKTYVERRGHFPSGTVSLGDQEAQHRLSWMAELYAKNSAGRTAEPQWDQPWNDPLNDRFVRQQQEPFLNPLISERVGPDRYPATHFVGVAGVGADAPGLPRKHRRAGIFGIGRETRPEDIKDGMAQTMMVAGVQDHLGSWAAGGQPTMRAFTQEPYFGGPDGFGTGEPGGMSVLMADGSVRFLSKNTAPVIVRRMAAMADGWPLDEAVPGEPGDSPPKESMFEEPPVIAETKPMPVPVPKVMPKLPIEPDPPKALEVPPEEPVDIPAALAVSIVKFEQIKEAPFQELLDQLEELCGVPIRPAADLPPADAELWNRRITLSLKDTTVRQILETLLAKVGLRFTIEPDHIQLHSAK